jgi:hypothetical protein
MSQYRGYFVPGMVDPEGTISISLATDKVKSFVNLDATGWWFKWHTDITLKPAPVAGMLMQYVDVSANVEPWKRRVVRQLEGNKHPLYEIWPLDAAGKVTLAAVKGQMPFDAFAWSSDPADLRDTWGTFSIDGNFSFFAGAAMPPDSVGTFGVLPIWKQNPFAGVKPSATKGHSCSITWYFCGGEKSVILTTSEGDRWSKSL